MGLVNESYNEKLFGGRERMSTQIFSEDGELGCLTEDVEILRERVEGFKNWKGGNYKVVKIENERLIKENTRLRAFENSTEKELHVLGHENKKLSV